MKAIEKRLSALEGKSSRLSINLDLIPDEDLAEMERLMVIGLLSFTADDVRLFQRHGFLAGVLPGPGVLRDWFSPDDVAELEIEYGKNGTAN